MKVSYIIPLLFLVLLFPAHSHALISASNASDATTVSTTRTTTNLLLECNDEPYEVQTIVIRIYNGTLNTLHTLNIGGNIATTTNTSSVGYNPLTFTFETPIICQNTTISGTLTSPTNHRFVTSNISTYNSSIFLSTAGLFIASRIDFSITPPETPPPTETVELIVPDYTPFLNFFTILLSITFFAASILAFRKISKYFL